MPNYGPDLDYGEWAEQELKWPRQGIIDPTLISDMPPAHAINAYRKFCTWFQDNRSRVGTYTNPENAARSPLARALLRQAVGRPVVYTDDLPASPVTPSNVGALDIVGAHLSLEMVYDAVVETEDIDHPVTRARVILSAIKNQQE